MELIVQRGSLERQHVASDFIYLSTGFGLFDGYSSGRNLPVSELESIRNSNKVWGGFLNRFTGISLLEKKRRIDELKRLIEAGVPREPTNWTQPMSRKVSIGRLRCF